MHDLLVKELGAELIPDSDKTPTQEWAQPLKEKEDSDMGMFDDLVAAGIDLGDVDLNPFEYNDGIYIMAFVRAEIMPPREEKWDPQLELNYVFVSMSDGSETKYKGKSFTERFRIPSAASLKSDDDGVKKGAEGHLTRLFQRIHQLGHPNPASADVVEMNEKFRGNKYIVPLNTPKPKPGFDERQFVGIVKPLKSDEDATSDLFKK